MMSKRITCEPNRGMGRPSPIIQRYGKLVGFLVLTVGIVWIVVQLTTRMQEGFQTTAATCPPTEGCEPKRMIAGIQTYLCADSTAALGKTYETGVLSSDRICYRAASGDSNCQFTCFDRPAPVTIDFDTGIPMSIDPSDDPAPYTNNAMFDTTCKTLPRDFIELKKTYNTTRDLRNNVEHEVKTLVDTGNILSNLYTTYCRPTPTRDPLKKVCDRLSESIQIVDANAKNPNLSTLQFLTREAAGQMSNLLFIKAEAARNLIPCIPSIESL